MMNNQKEINQYMQKAIDLAEKGKGFVNPNPLVGAVIVKNGKIIGEGYHECFGQAHAEVNAFLNATEDVEGADMYVTLEPCSHYGKTPPCALKIIEKKIKRVFISQLDPNPLVNSKGVKLLKDAGIEVTSGILEDQSRKQNEIFLKYIQEKVPFVAMKYAMTLDGKIATKSKDSKWITNEKSRAYVHELRNQYMAILVGANTVIADDPHLDTRRENQVSRNPIRIIIDPDLSIPLNSYLIQTARTQPTWIVTSLEQDDKKIKLYEDLGVKMIMKPTTPLDLKDLMKTLGELKIDSLLIEGGSYVHAKALESGIVDKVYAFIAPKIIGGKDALSPIGGDGMDLMRDAYQLKNVTYHTFDEDILIEGYLNYAK
ncbi:MAG: bifunctional diaminohydroxyphosphoribosylaminopyrimidine deaminase/5-amino-6-(5-phosphoribosylamino)uracil reductase RibD [Acholeplasmataceae bacterium]|jgi:diaminohydroxyphosphoribosylaminopyrimidine deaminase/5-amino-6-(5-phosphoribosylamino)uracil reductase|nr:bifunctional diaminohydroxyphosphoribosylaminopyrimidine deaminase/5-amino-6-(5-phosphoribosylamino)uracil reductase RibD [Acholeplasmataceae bacterium]